MNKKITTGIAMIIILLNITLTYSLTKQDEEKLNSIYIRATEKINGFNEKFTIEVSSSDLQKELNKQFSEFNEEEKSRVWSRYYLDLRQLMINYRENYFKSIVDTIDKEKERVNALPNNQQKKEAEKALSRYNKMYNAAKDGQKQTSDAAIEKVTIFENKDLDNGLKDGITKGLFGKKTFFKKPEIKIPTYEDAKIIYEKESTTSAEQGVPGWVTGVVNGYNAIPLLPNIDQENVAWTRWINPFYAVGQGYKGAWGDRKWFPGKIITIIVIITLFSMTSKKRRDSVEKFFSSIPIVGSTIGKLITFPAKIIVLLNWLRKQLMLIRYISNIPNACICLLLPERWAVGWKEKKHIWDFTWGNMIRALIAFGRTLTYVEHWTSKKLPTHKQVEDLGHQVAARDDAIQKLNELTGNLQSEIQRLNIELSKQVGVNNDLRIQMLRILSSMQNKGDQQQGENPPGGQA